MLVGQIDLVDPAYEGSPFPFVGTLDRGIITLGD
jgi:hypothetical protein